MSIFDINVSLLHFNFQKNGRGYLKKECLSLLVSFLGFKILLYIKWIYLHTYISALPLFFPFNFIFKKKIEKSVNYFLKLYKNFIIICFISI